MPEVIEFFDNTGKIFVYRYPSGGSKPIVWGSQLVVQSNQVGFFFRDGKVLDYFGPGRYTLETQNLPMLTALIGTPFNFTSPFRAFVYFMSTQTITGLGWGTAAPVLFRDADFKHVNLRGNGTYSLRIEAPYQMLNSLVGTKGLHTVQSLEQFFRSAINSHFADELGKVATSVMDLPAKYNELGQRIKDKIKDEFGQYGIEIVDFYVEAITMPKEVRDMINKAVGINVQDVEKYKAVQISDAIRESASKGGGGSLSALLGAGVGLGAGMGLGQSMAGSMAPPQQQQPTIVTTQAAPAAPVAPVGKCCPKCKNPVEETFVMCPICKKRLKKACVNQECKRQIEEDWEVCPYCGADQ